MKRSRSIQPRSSTCLTNARLLTAAERRREIVANVSAMLEQRGAVASADIGHRPVNHRRGVFARENVNMDVLGMLVRRQHAHANHKALFVKAERSATF